MYFVHCKTFDEWRDIARRLLAGETSPDSIHWSDPAEQPALFQTQLPGEAPAAKHAQTARVPSEFLKLAKTVACHRSPERWPLLYRSLWRLTHGERFLLQLSTDPDVHQLEQMQKAVSRDMHKMKAFVRFRRVVSDNGEEQFIAWHRPDHRVVPSVAPFFARRFARMDWTILTPDESVTWREGQLHFGPGVASQAAPDSDTLEDLWRAYYAATFNPARLNTSLMKREMPVRYWPALPETTIIPELLDQASARVNTMLATCEGSETSALDYLPVNRDLPSLTDAASVCRGCDLNRDATQTVFGEGPPTARIVIVGEQPGDQEDTHGRPFVGPAGQLLDAALASAGISRQQIYLTNVVKHFKFVERGKRRLHQKPAAREITACQPWLEAELDAIRPAALICLGATAAQALLGREFRITRSRGQVIQSRWCERTVATWHPAAILRMIDKERQAAMRVELIADLAVVV